MTIAAGSIQTQFASTSQTCASSTTGLSQSSLSFCEDSFHAGEEKTEQRRQAQDDDEEASTSTQVWRKPER